jgi:hypothetical protein
VACSDALSFAPNDHNSTIILADGWRVVFGGDYVDKGPSDGFGGSVRVVRALLALKRTYPTRVTLILGNRDLNKMRLTSELDAAEIANIEATPGPYWVRLT